MRDAFIDGLLSGCPAIATKAEHEALSAARAIPEPGMHLRPEGADCAAVNTLVCEANERRMRDLRERLDRARAGIETQQALRFIHGRAKSDFERSR